MEIARYRLHNQHIATSRSADPGAVVSMLGAMQAQDYPGTLWAIGLRVPEASLPDVERAVADRKIVRTWPMRGTLHFVAAEDIRWMLELLSPRIISGAASRYKELELDEATFARCFKVLEKNLSGDKQLTRAEIFAAFEKSRISVDDSRGYHILRRAGQEKIICFAPPRGKQDAFTLLDEWIPASKELSGDGALAELALRYFSGHGPAALDDFVWWSGLKVIDARSGLEMVKAKLAHESLKGGDYWMPNDMPECKSNKKDVYLLPGFDEYLLGYKNRTAALDPEHAQRICPGNNGMFAPTLVKNGKVIGTWKRTLKKDKVILSPDFFNARTKSDDAYFDAAERYCKFILRSLSR